MPKFETFYIVPFKAVKILPFNSIVENTSIVPIVFDIKKRMEEANIIYKDFRYRWSEKNFNMIDLIFEYTVDRFYWNVPPNTDVFFAPYKESVLTQKPTILTIRYHSSELSETKLLEEIYSLIDEHKFDVNVNSGWKAEIRSATFFWS